MTEPDGQAPAPANSGFFPTLLRTLRGMFSFGGRAPRGDVIVYAITALLLVPLLLSLGQLITGRDLPREANLAIGGVLALPFFALFARRCHDSGRSAHWTWLLVPGLTLPLARGLAGLSGGIYANLQLDRFIWPLDWLSNATNVGAVVLCLFPGTQGPNAYGDEVY